CARRHYDGYYPYYYAMDYW
nr:immunoglobulin heavy chain junction region [Mus musculus]MBK4197485.1 immunoglobulin heavy chain junction region [Mus musculus]